MILPGYDMECCHMGLVQPHIAIHSIPLGRYTCTQVLYWYSYHGHRIPSVYTRLRPSHNAVPSIPPHTRTQRSHLLYCMWNCLHRDCFHKDQSGSGIFCLCVGGHRYIDNYLLRQCMFHDAGKVRSNIHLCSPRMLDLSIPGGRDTCTHLHRQNTHHSLHKDFLHTHQYYPHIGCHGNQLHIDK